MCLSHSIESLKLHATGGSKDYMNISANAAVKFQIGSTSLRHLLCTLDIFWIVASWHGNHYSDVIRAMTSQIIDFTVVCSTVYSGADQSSASLAFVWRIQHWPVDFTHKRPVTRKMFPFDDVTIHTHDSVSPFIWEGNWPTTVNSAYKWCKVMQTFDIFYVNSRNHLLNKQSSGRWFETPCHSCNV